MKRSTVGRLVLGGLIAALSVLYGATHWLTGGPASAGAATAALPAADGDGPLSPVSAAGMSEALRQEQQAWAAADWPADPFFRFRDPAARHRSGGNSEDSRAPSWLALSAVLSGAEPLALINGRVVAVGEQLADGSTIVAIDADSVTLEGSQGTWTLKLSE